MSMQICLFDAALPRDAEPAVDPLLQGLRRIDLGGGAWVDHLPRWLTGHQDVFDALAAGLDWKAQRRQMYDREVDVPRLVAGLPAGTGHPVVWLASDVLTRFYKRPLNRLSAAWYRNGQDSVAPHGDKVAHKRDTLVATVSVGQPRRFTLRPVGGGPGLDLHLGWGDLVVMGGSCQAGWLHGIPKAPGTGTRISIMFRLAPEDSGG